MEAELKQALKEFQYAERLKSELIIGFKLLERLEGLNPEHIPGGEKILTAFLEALLTEIRIAHNATNLKNFAEADKKIMQALGRISLRDYYEAERCISEALTFITSACHGSLQILVDKDLI
ncbi:MAG: hypothetical protein QXJ68_05140 [Methanocellales archaeon]